MTRILTLAGLSAALFLAVSSLAAAHDVVAGDLTLQHPWSRATPGGAKVGGAYVTIVNAGEEPDRLVGGSAEIADRFEIHEMSVADGVMTMRHLPDGLEIPAGGEVVLKPGSYHIMLMGLERPLVQGERIAGTLAFEKAGPVAVEFVVEALGATRPAGDEKGGAAAGGAMPHDGGMDHGHGSDHGAPPSN